MTIWTKLAAYAYLETENLLLRPFSYNDGQAFYRIVSHPENLSFIFPFKAKKEEALDLMVEMFLKNPLGKWAIEDKVNHQLIGAISFENWQEQKNQVELGYFIRKDYWGQGLATEAVKNITWLGLHQMGLSRISIIAHLENKASQRVAEKSDYVLLKQYKGSDRYSHQMRQYRHYYVTKQMLKEAEREKRKNDYH